MAYNPAVSDFSDIPINNVNNQESPIYNASPSDFSDIPLNQPNQVTTQPSSIVNNSFFPSLFNQVANGSQNYQNMVNNLKNPQQLGKAAIQATGALGMIAAPELEAPEIVSGAISQLPKIAQGGINYLGRVGMGTGITSAMNYGSKNPDNNLQNNIESNAILESVPPVLGIASQAASSMMPQSFVKKALNMLSPGSNSLEDNAQSLASDIRDAYNKRTQEASDQYQPVLSKYGDKSIYPFQPPSGGGHAGFTNQPNLTSIFGNDVNVGSTYNDFVKNPTLQNAHDLQSQMAVNIRQYQNSPSTPELRNTIDSLGNARQKILGDMNNYLQSIDPNAANQYQLGAELFRQNVAPYRSDPQLMDIATGIDTNPKNVQNIFTYKNPFQMKNGQTVDSPINKVISDLPQQSQNKIIYAAVGGNKANQSANALANSLVNAKNNGFQPYFNSEVQGIQNSLNDKIANKSTWSHLGSGVLGGLLGNLTGIPGMEEAGAIAGASAPKLINAVIPNISKVNISEPIINALKQSYSPIGRALITRHYGQAT